MNKFQFKSSNNNPLQIPINENYKEKIFSLASSHELSELEDFITTNSISLKLKNDKNETITHVLLKGESTILEDELLRCMKFLVERGAPISSIDSYYLTPLFICIEKKYSKIFKYLLEKGASLDINTYDNLNILHTIAKPEHTIFDTKNGGIQDLIPEKLPKIKIEGYKEVYEKINKVIAIEDAVAAAVAGPRPRQRPVLSPALRKINEGLQKFKTIAKQFYYDNEREDFNNILLIEDFKNTDDIEQKNDLFGKLKDQLKYFYDDTENIDEYELKNELDQQIQNNITNLNNEITQEKMQGYNNNLLNAIKNLATSLELSIHYFFLKDPENIYIATDVVIAIAESVIVWAPQNGTNVVELILQIYNVVREAVQIVKVATIEAKREKTFSKQIINIIKTQVINVITVAGVQAAQIAAGAGLVALANAAFIAALPQGRVATLVFPVVPVLGGVQNQISQLISDDRALNIINNIREQIAGAGAGAGAAAAHAVLQRAQLINNAATVAADRITNATNAAAHVVKYVNQVKIDTRTVVGRAAAAAAAAAPAAIGVPAAGPPQVNEVIAVLQTTTRAAVYAAVYAQNKTAIVAAAGPPVLEAGLAPELENLPAIYTAVDASVLAETANINQEEIQKALSDPVVAIEAVLFAADQAVQAVRAVRGAGVQKDVMVSALKEALQNIDASKENIDIIITIANKARTTDEILLILQTYNVVRETVQIVKVATKVATKVAKIEKTISKDIINIIKTEVIDVITVTARNALGGGGAFLAALPQGRVTNRVFPVLAVPGGVQNQISRLISDDRALNIINNIREQIAGAGAVAAAAAAAADAILQRAQLINNAATVAAAARITNAADAAAHVVRYVNQVKIDTRAVVNTVGAAGAAAPAAIGVPAARPPQVNEVIAVLQTTTRAGIYAAVYTQNEYAIGGAAPGHPVLVATAEPKLTNLPAIYTAVDASVLSGIAEANINQEEIQKALSDPVVAIEAVLFAANQAVSAVITVRGIFVQKDVMLAALREALKQPPIIPQNFKNNDYNELIKSYKLINIPQKYINYNIPYNYENINIKESVDLINYKLPEGDRSYCIDYFNLLYTFNEYVKDNYNPIIINNDIFTLYQCIQQIYKYNYIIYIFEKEKEKILRLKDSYITNINNNINLKKTINELFDNNYDEFVNNINLIREQLEKIKKLANYYIDNYNKLNGYEKYKNPDGNNIKIGIYPKIEFPTEIKHTLGDENAIIAKCDKNYITYNENKNDFFHNFVLYFQDIGKNGVNNTLLNSIPQPIDYNIDITNYETNIIDKAYKLYFYDSRYLKLEKQKIITELLSDPEISGINIPKYEYYKGEIANNFNNIIKNMILNEILEEKFNSFLVMEINKFFIDELSTLTPNLEYEHEIIQPNSINILSKLTDFKFRNILIPNYEFKNNKFLSITKNRFLKCILYFDTNYFKQTNLKELKYYKDNKFIEQIQASKLKTLLDNSDIKGWTPIYYAIDGNNYKVINKMLSIRKEILTHHDHKKISPIKLCINKQLQHLNYLLDEDNNIHFLNNYIDMLRNELKINNLLIPLNINAVFIITLFIQNNIFNIKQALPDEIQHLDNNNSRKIQINKEYNNIRKTRHDHFNYNDSKIDNILDKIDRKYDPKINQDYNYANSDETNSILKEYYIKARELENKDFGLYGTYWNKTKKYDDLIHIEKSKEFKQDLKNLINLETNNRFQKSNIQTQIIHLTSIKNKLERYLSFINIRFNANKNNAYDIFLNKIYVHVLANIIGVDFYLRMEELIIHNYISLNIVINDTVKEQLRILNKLLINNKLDDTNINYLYITAEKNPELVLKDKIKEILKNIFVADDIEIINIFETKVYPNYKELYRITYKYLQMFISNYHKFIYNQYHGLEILLLLLDKLE